MAKTPVCRCCGARLQPVDVWACQDCKEIGAGKDVMRYRRVTPGDRRELHKAVLERQKRGISILAGLGITEIGELAKIYGRTAYNTYGKLRAYIDCRGCLPEFSVGGPDYGD